MSDSAFAPLSALAPAPPADAPPVRSTSDWLGLLWASVAAAIIGRYFASVASVRWLTRDAEPVADLRWRDASDVASAELGSSGIAGAAGIRSRHRPVHQRHPPAGGRRADQRPDDLDRRADSRRAAPRTGARAAARLPRTGDVAGRLRRLLVQPAHLGGGAASARRARARLRRPGARGGPAGRRLRAALAGHRTHGDVASVAVGRSAGDGPPVGARRATARDPRRTSRAARRRRAILLAPGRRHRGHRGARGERAAGGARGHGRAR